MRAVKCINTISACPRLLTVGAKYWMDESSLIKSDSGEYAMFYTSHIKDRIYQFGQFLTVYFENV